MALLLGFVLPENIQSSRNQYDSSEKWIIPSFDIRLYCPSIANLRNIHHRHFESHRFQTLYNTFTELLLVAVPASNFKSVTVTFDRLGGHGFLGARHKLYLNATVPLHLY